MAISDPDYINTNIPSFNKLLGGQGFKTGTINIIKGGPGSGKTTLGLQLLNAHLKQNLVDKEREKKKIYNAIYISLETSGNTIIEYAKNAFKYDFQSYREVSLEDPKKTSDNFCCLSREDILTSLSGSIRKDSIDSPLIFQWEKIMASGVKLFSEKEEGNEVIQNLIFIDSLNVLIDLINAQTDYRQNPRSLFNLIYSSLPTGEFKTNTVFLFSVEYRGHSPISESLLNESFMSDCEILLSTEPIRGPFQPSTKDQSQTGYNLQINSKGEKVVDTRPFCRVLKSRYSKNESRRCLYDIVGGEGLKFYDTYPGDGEINLFHENAPQKDHWKDFLKHDIEFSYPALRQTTFNRGSLQRTFMSFRQFKHIPEKIDMYLTSLDNYWINWYADLRRKWEIHKNLRQFLKKDDNINEVCNFIHKELTKTKLNVSDIRKDLEDPEIYEDITIQNDYGLSDDVRKQIIADNMPGIVDYFLDKILDYLSEKESSRCYKCHYSSWLFQCLVELLPGEESCEIQDIFEELRQKHTFEDLESWLSDTEKKLLRESYKKPIKDQLSQLASSVSDIVKNIRINSADYKDFDGFFKPFHQLKDLKPGSPLCHEIQKDGFKGEPFLKPILAINEEYRDSLIKDPTYKPDNGSNPTQIKDPEQQSQIAASGASEKQIDLVRKIISKNIETLYANTFFDNLKTLCEKHSLSFTGVVHSYISIHHNLSELNTSSLLKGIPKKSLRIFGEKKSPIIRELERFSFGENRPIHYADTLFSWRDREQYISVPYNANIGFLVYRKKILKNIFKQINEDRSGYVKEVATALYHQLASLNSIKGMKIVSKQLNVDGENGKSPFISDSDYYRKLSEAIPYDFNNPQPSEKLIGALTEKLKQEYFTKEYFSDQQPPRSWEEIIAMLIIDRKKNSFLIETSTFDSYLSTFLEIFWSFGGDLKVLPDYTIEEVKDTFCQLYLSFYTLAYMFDRGTVPINSTLEPKKISKNNYRENGDWAFARQWHSTFIEFLTYESKVSGKSPGSKEEFFRKKNKPDLDIMPIPSSMLNILQNKGDVKHISCWGDWHMAMTAGSENDDLAINLINNLMSSRKISERAFCGAELPTANLFYKLYNDVHCFNIPNINPGYLPDKTFREIREMLFRDAKSRTQIFDYRHTMREFHSVLEFVHHRKHLDPIHSDKQFAGKLFRRINKAVEKINGFNEMDILVS